MTQLRHDYPRFKELNTEVVLCVPNGPRVTGTKVQGLALPYPVLMDKGSRVAETYSQIKKFWVAGTPLLVLVDKSGRILYIRYMGSLIDEPDNQEVIALLEKAQD